MVTQTTIPVESLGGLELNEGDRFSGEVHDGVINITVVAANTGSSTSGVGFARRWRGKFKGLLEQDHSDDSRAEYLLDR